MGSRMTRKSPVKVDKRQRDRFIKAAREAGASEDEREFDENLRRIATRRPEHEAPKRKPRR